MFETNVKKSFLASHAISMPDGRRENLHEHLWRCEVSVLARELDACGCVVDFSVVEKAIADAVFPLTRRDIGSTNTFKDTPASTENIAKYIYEHISPILNDERKYISKVTVWEDECRSAVFYAK